MNAVTLQAEPVREATSLLMLIERVITNPNTGMEALTQLLALQERVMSQKARSAYDEAFSAMQPELPTIDERGAILNNAGKVQSTYARWEDINETIKPILSRYGFSLSFRVTRESGRVVVTGILAHRDGHREETTLELEVDSSGGKNGAHAVGSSVSYGQRYTAKLLLNITSRLKEDRDDGGQAASQSAGMSAAITSINMAETVAELQGWKAKNSDALEGMPTDEADAVVRLWNARMRRVKEAAPKGAGQ